MYRINSTTFIALNFTNLFYHILCLNLGIESENNKHIFMLKSVGFNLNFVNFLVEVHGFEGTGFREYGVHSFEGTGVQCTGHIVSHYPIRRSHKSLMVWQYP